jgi:hypothetical protein
VASSPDEPDSIRVVLDANVYVRAAVHLGPGVPLNALPSPMPPFEGHPDYNAAQVVSMVLSGTGPGDHVLIPCICDHIADLIFSALTSPEIEGGEGWEISAANSFLNDLYDGLNGAGGVQSDVTYPRHGNILGDDDGRVFSAAVESEARVLVTADVPFRVKANGLQGIAVMNPLELLERLDKSAPRR